MLPFSSIGLFTSLESLSFHTLLSSMIEDWETEKLIMTQREMSEELESEAEMNRKRRSSNNNSERQPIDVYREKRERMDWRVEDVWWLNRNFPFDSLQLKRGGEKDDDEKMDSKGGRGSKLSASRDAPEKCRRRSIFCKERCREESSQGKEEICLVIEIIKWPNRVYHEKGGYNHHLTHLFEC